jgi:hypothetical protein
MDEERRPTMVDFLQVIGQRQENTCFFIPLVGFSLTLRPTFVAHSMNILVWFASCHNSHPGIISQRSEPKLQTGLEPHLHLATAVLNMRTRLAEKDLEIEM